MNKIKRFNELDNNINESLEYDEEGWVNVRVKDVIEYLQTLDPEAIVDLDHDGWMEKYSNPTDVLDLIGNRGIFSPWKDKEGNDRLTINN